MRTIYPERRLDQKQFHYLDHAVDLARTHGWHYAVEYLHNQRVPEPIIQRVLFDEWQHRRASANKLIICQQMSSA